MKDFLDRYELSIYSIGLFRISLGVGLIISLTFFKIPGLSLFYYHDAFFDVALNKSIFGPLSYSVLDLLQNHYLVKLYFVICFVVFALFAIGYHTRVTSVFALLLYWQLNQRGFLVSSAADLYASCMLMLSIFLPLDVALVPRKIKHNKEIFLPNFRLICLFVFVQIGLIYFASGLLKSDIGWLNGTALINVLNDNLMSREIWRTLDFSWLSKFDLVVLVLEALLGICILFNPFGKSNLRWVLSVCIVIFHLAFIIFLDLWQFMLFAFPAAILLSPISLNKSRAVLLRHKSNKKSAFYTIVLSVFFLLVVIINVKDIVNYGHFASFYQKTKIKRVVNIIKVPKVDYMSFLSQRWMIYSFLPDGFGCFSVEGKLANNQTINLWTKKMDNGCVCQYNNYVQKNFLGLTRLMITLKRANPEFFKHWTKHSLIEWNASNEEQMIDTAYMYYNYLERGERKKILMVNYNLTSDAFFIDLESLLPIVMDRDRSE